MDIWDDVFDINGDGVTDLYEDTLAVELMEDEIEEEESDRELWAMDDIETDEDLDDDFDDDFYDDLKDDSWDDFDDDHNEFGLADDDYDEEPFLLFDYVRPELNEESRAFMENLREERIGYALEYLADEEVLRSDMLPGTDLDMARERAGAMAQAGETDYINFMDINGNIIFENLIEYFNVISLDELDQEKPDNLYNEFVLKTVNETIMYFDMFHLLVDTVSRFSPYFHFMSDRAFIALMQPLLSIETIYRDNPLLQTFEYVIAMEAEDTFFRDLRPRFDVRTRILAEGALNGYYVYVRDILEDQRYMPGQTFDNYHRICDAVRDEIMLKNSSVAGLLPGYSDKKVYSSGHIDERQRIYGISMKLFDSQVYYCKYYGKQSLELGDCVILWVSKINRLEMAKGYIVSIGDYLEGTEPAEGIELGIIVRKSETERV